MKIETLLADHQLYHSEFQMDHFITAKAGGPTAYGQYKQALRELHKRVQGLAQLRTQLQLLELDIEELSVGNYEPDPFINRRFVQRRNAIKLQQKKMEHEEVVRNLADSQREYDHFFKQAVSLKEIVGDLGGGRREQLEKAMWFETLKARCAFDFITGGRISKETFDLLFSCPPQWRIILEDKNHPALVAWFQNLKPLALERGGDETSETKALPAIAGG